MAEWYAKFRADTSGVVKDLQTVARTQTFKVNIQADGTQIKTLNKEIEKAVDKQGNLTTTTKTLNQKTGEWNTTIKESSKQVKTLGQDFLDTAGKVAKFGAITAIIGAFTGAVAEAGKTVKEFDDTLVEFRKVSDLSGDSLTEYTKKLAEMGEVTGSTMTSMVSAATEFKKSGFSDEDSATLASVAEMYRNIADEEISAADSASFIIAQMKAFNITVSESEHIIDAVNEVSNNFAVSSADLATNLGKVSSTLAITGTSYEQALGMLTAITEITRNASTASRGL